MHIANIGLSEIILILIVAVIIFGPRNIVKTAQDAGDWVKKASKSPFLREIMATRKELDELPKVLARETHLDETLKELNKETSKASRSVTETLRDAVREAQMESAGKPESPKLTSEIPQAPADPPAGS